MALRVTDHTDRCPPSPPILGGICFLMTWHVGTLMTLMITDYTDERISEIMPSVESVIQVLPP